MGRLVISVAAAEIVEPHRRYRNLFEVWVARCIRSRRARSTELGRWVVREDEWSSESAPIILSARHSL